MVRAIEGERLYNTFVHEVKDVRDKEEVGHARREVREAEFRRRASAKDE